MTQSEPEREHTTPPLDERKFDPNPIKQFQRWYNEAVGAKVSEPEAMALATATKGGIPSVRMILLKHFDTEGFVFYTSYNSRKGRELKENPLAVVVFS